MIGQDCKQFEVNIEKFVNCFLKVGETVLDKSFEKMKNVVTLYCMFRDLAEDIRATAVHLDCVKSFEERAENFFQTFKRYSMDRCTGKKPCHISIYCAMTPLNL